MMSRIAYLARCPLIPRKRNNAFGMLEKYTEYALLYYRLFLPPILGFHDLELKPQQTDLSGKCMGLSLKALRLKLVWMVLAYQR
jgi:hypothetical protein